MFRDKGKIGQWHDLSEHDPRNHCGTHFGSSSLLACAASVSNRVIARKLEREQKKWNREGEGKRRNFSPLPLPRHSFFLLSSQLSRRTRAETLAIQASSLLVSKVANNCLVSQCLITDCYLQPCCVVIFLVVDFNGLVFYTLLFV